MYTLEQIEKIERATHSQLDSASFMTDFMEIGRIDTRGASALANRWNETDKDGNIVVPYQFHKKYPSAYRNLIMTYG